MANLAEPGACAACGRRLPAQTGRGRRRLYCNAHCRDRARRRRDRAAGQRVNADLTSPTGDVYVDADGAASGKSVLATVGALESARRLARELEQPGSPLGAVAAARDLVAAAEAALQGAVDEARAGGRSWREIGAALGTSRQAAFQRFGRPVDPRTGAAMIRTVPPGAVERATVFLALFTAGRWEEVLDCFDGPMRARHDAGRLAGGWAQMIGMFGSYEGSGEVFPVAATTGMAVDVLLRFEAGEAMLWIRFDREGKVTGLRLHPAPTREARGG